MFIRNLDLHPNTNRNFDTFSDGNMLYVNAHRIGSNNKPSVSEKRRSSLIQLYHQSNNVKNIKNYNPPNVIKPNNSLTKFSGSSFNPPLTNNLNSIPPLSEINNNPTTLLPPASPVSSNGSSESTPTLNIANETTNNVNKTQFNGYTNSNSISPSSSISTIPPIASPKEKKEQPPALLPDEILIHVHDETNKINKDFICNRDILIKEMKYFRAYLSESKTKNEDIDISVHCDVNIFQWLMDYIKRPNNAPKLEINWAVSILISSHFLEMDNLVETSLDFVYENFNQIVKLPIDLDCIHNDLIERLATKFTDWELDEIRDRKDKILSKLFMKKLEALLEKPENALYRCSKCGKLFTKAHYEWMVCNSKTAKLHIDFHGRAISRHTVDKDWNIHKYLLKLKKSGMTWREIYWKCWSLVHSFYCTRCKHRFTAAEFGHCSFHKKEPKFEAGSITGEYPCCGGKALKFNSGLVVPKGCCTRNHVINESQEKDESILTDNRPLNILLSRHHNLLIPYGANEDNTETNEENSEEDIDIDIEILNIENNLENTTIETEDEDEDSPEQVNFFKSGFQKYQIFDEFNGTDASKEPESLSTINIKKKTLNKRFNNLDLQRDVDRENLNEIIKMLRKCRKDQATKTKAPPIAKKKKPQTSSAKSQGKEGKSTASNRPSNIKRNESMVNPNEGGMKVKERNLNSVRGRRKKYLQEQKNTLSQQTVEENLEDETTESKEEIQIPRGQSENQSGEIPLQAKKGWQEEGIPKEQNKKKFFGLFKGNKNESKNTTNDTTTSSYIFQNVPRSLDDKGGDSTGITLIPSLDDTSEDIVNTAAAEAPKDYSSQKVQTLQELDQNTKATLHHFLNMKYDNRGIDLSLLTSALSFPLDELEVDEEWNHNTFVQTLLHSMKEEKKISTNSTLSTTTLPRDGKTLM